MANHRTYTDGQLIEAVANATCWSDVMEGVGKKRNAQQDDVKAVVARMGLDTSHFHHLRSATPVAPPRGIFTERPRRSARSGLITASKWFLDRGYAVSVPLEPAAYDLVADSDVGLQRVQIKTTRRKAGSGRYTVALTRTVYQADAAANAGGKYRQIKYEPGTVDFFFIIADDGSQYLIPFGAVSAVTSLVLDHKYKAFLV